MLIYSQLLVNRTLYPVTMIKNEPTLTIASRSKVHTNVPFAESELSKVSEFFKIAQSIAFTRYTNGELTTEQKIKLGLAIKQYLAKYKSLQVDIKELQHREKEKRTYLKQKTERKLFRNKQVKEIRSYITRNGIKFVKKMIRILNLTESDFGTNRITFCKYATYSDCCQATYFQCLSEI